MTGSLGFLLQYGFDLFEKLSAYVESLGMNLARDDICSLVEGIKTGIWESELGL